MLLGCICNNAPQQTVYCMLFGQNIILVNQIGLDEDPRLKAMKKEWLEGKNCLDIGCNSGAVTIPIGMHLKL
nr:probable RNA methyltransferase At5g51130 [Ipomoea trifida]